MEFTQRQKDILLQLVRIEIYASENAKRAAIISADKDVMEKFNVTFRELLGLASMLSKEEKS